MTSAVRVDVAFTLATEVLPLCFYHFNVNVVVRFLPHVCRHEQGQLPNSRNSLKLATALSCRTRRLWEPLPPSRDNILKFVGYRKCVPCPCFPWLDFRCLGIQSFKVSVIHSVPSQAVSLTTRGYISSWRVRVCAST